MAMNASGVRDTARVLKISPTTVIKELGDQHLCNILWGLRFSEVTGAILCGDGLVEAGQVAVAAAPFQ
jgi:hypothetical protein